MRVEFDSLAQAVAAHDKRRSPLWEWGRARLPDLRRHRRLSARVSGRRFPPPWTVEELTKVAAQKRSGNLCSAILRHWFERNMPVTLVLLMAFEISVALALGFVVGRIYQIRCDERVTLPPTARIPQP